MDNKLNCISFKNIIGYDREIEELMEIKKYVIERDKYTEVGARVPKGILLVGESGNGKTLMAKALANEINIPFYSLGDSENIDETSKSIKELFKEARKNAPCVIFIDELDKLGNKSLGFNYGFDEDNSGLIRELLTQMDGFNSNEGIIVIATANQTYNLNLSLLRSGRFDRTINIKMPSLKDREKLFEHYSKTRKLEENIDFHKLAIRTSGICCADVDNILNEAALMSIREGREKISSKMIEESIDRVTFSSATTNRLSDDLKKKIAIHEIGHAVVAIANGNIDDIDKISIVSRGQNLGFTKMRSDDDLKIYGYTTRSEMYNRIEKAYGGIAAEEVILKDVSSGVSGDLYTASEICNTMVSSFGMLGVTNCCQTKRRLNADMSEYKQRKIEKVKDRILNKAYKNAKKKIKKNKKIFNELYNMLLENNVLYKEEVVEIVERYRG